MLIHTYHFLHPAGIQKVYQKQYSANVHIEVLVLKSQK